MTDRARAFGDPSQQARRAWKALYRRIRIIRREHRKVASDMLLYGTGFLLVDKSGEPRRVHPSEVIL